jgi:succinate-semialdehyde dehydrogenase/glutarate-semialdehyde dehydrogenase
VPPVGHQSKTTGRSCNQDTTLIPDLRTDLLVGGEWQVADRQLTVINPATGEALADVVDADAGHGLAAAEKAAAVQEAWSRSSPRSRSAMLMQVHLTMLDREPELAGLIVAETGRPVTEAAAEVRYAAEFLRWFAEEAVRVGGEYRIAPDGASRILTARRPVGLCLLVTPWNFPAAMVARKLGPAFAAGCTAILKPAEQTPLTALWLAQAICDAGLPAGVLSVLPTSRPGELVDAVLGHPAIRKLSFTGSTPVGRHLQEQTGRRLLGTSMELGGNAPYLVLEDADVDAAIDGAMIAKMRNGGQACVAANRFFVHERHAKTFVSELARRVQGLRAGPLEDPRTEVGALIDDRAVVKLEHAVAGALEEGTTLLTGGVRPERPGSWYPATVITDVDPSAEILGTELFGPVAPIVSFSDEAMLARMANNSAAGLAAYVYTRDVGRALDWMDRLEVGMVAVNRGMVSNPAAPFGAVKQSGVGRKHAGFAHAQSGEDRRRSCAARTAADVARRSSSASRMSPLARYGSFRTAVPSVDSSTTSRGEAVTSATSRSLPVRTLSVNRSGRA